MATIENVTPYYSRKVQLDRFEPVEFGMGLEVSLEAGDDPDEVFDQYLAVVQDAVERALAERIAQAKRDDRD